MPMPHSAQPPSMHPRHLFAYPFRIFFLSLGLLAVVTIPLWLLMLTGQLQLPLAMPSLFWHQHELLFGVLTAAIAGFLLTAVCVWTSTERLNGMPLFMLWAVWLAGRLLLALGGDLPGWLVQGVNLAFLPLVMADAGRRIVAARQYRQLMIMLVLGLLWVMQLGFVSSYRPVFAHGALVMMLALIAIIGGRITPAFTGNWLRQQGVTDTGILTRARLDMASVISLILLLATLFLGIPPLTAALAVLAALVMLARMAGWKGWRAAREPLLWILHLSILWVPVSLLLMAGHLMLDWPATTWVHAAGTGAMGGLILGVIARVSLGHTGRPLKLHPAMTIAFVLIQLAAVLRVLTGFGWLPWHTGLGISSLLWSLAFGFFVVCYGWILSTPRADNKPG